MIDPTDELKTRAEILHKRIAAGDPRALARLRVLAEMAQTDDVRRKHCLAVVAREAGFTSWKHASDVLRGHAAEHDFGTLLYDSETCRATLNAWFANHEEARAHLLERRERGEQVFLLAYKRQFLVVDAHFIEALGLDPADPDWMALRYDWARPELAARKRLYAKRLAAVGRRA